jgi:DNA (cytosine-5)-methyltransferase 1
MPKQKKNVVFKLGELFCGPGGIALGALSALAETKGSHYRIEHAWASDYDKDTCDTYKKNICPDSKGSVFCKDVRELSFKNMPPIDALAFGFPCNDFSLVGEKKGIDGAFGPLYSYGVKALRHFKPKWFLAENVGGLKTANEGNTFNLILQELAESGYNVTPHLYKLEQYGVPQTRHRIIIIGIRRDLDVEFKVPFAPTKPVSCKMAIENPPIAKNAPNHEYTKMSDIVVKRLSYIKPGQNAFNATLPKSLQLNVKGATMSQIYRRLDPRKPSYTVTGSGGGGTHVYHWKEHRALTNRERARIQTFPDSFVFSGSKESARKQIGMAVPPLGAKVICEAVLKSFAGIPYPHIEQNLFFSIEENKKCRA